MSMVKTLLAAEQGKLEEAKRIVEENGLTFIKESKKYAGKHPVINSDAFQKYLVQACGGCDTKKKLDEVSFNNGLDLSEEGISAAVWEVYNDEIQQRLYDEDGPMIENGVRASLKGITKDLAAESNNLSTIEELKALIRQRIEAAVKQTYENCTYNDDEDIYKACCGGKCGCGKCGGGKKTKLKHTCAICGEECDKVDDNGICDLCSEEMNG